MNSSLPEKKYTSLDNSGRKDATTVKGNFLSAANNTFDGEDESVLLNLFENSPVGISITKINGCLFVNKAFCNILGYTVEELQNKTWKDITYPSDIEKTEKHLEKLINNQSPTTRFDKRYVHKNGKIVWVDVSTYLKKDTEGNHRYFITSIIDITDRVDAEDALRISEFRFHSTLDNMIEGCQILDKEWRYLYINKAAEKQIGRPASELFGKRYPDVWPGIENTEAYSIIKNCLYLGIPAHFENHFIFSDGNSGWFELSVQPVPEGVFILSVDVSEKKLNENILKNHIELLAFSAGNNSHHILQKTLDQVCELTNSSIGFYHFIDEAKKEIVLQAWSTKTTNEFCKAEGSNLHYPIDKAGVWAECILTRCPVIHNDYASLSNKKGLPPGHAIVVRELVVPIFRDNKIVAILGVGNKVSWYTQRDIETVKYFADIAWEIAVHKLAEEKIQDFNVELKNKIEEATNELQDLYNNAPCGYHSLNSDGYFELINDTELNWLGYARDEILHKLKFKDIITPESIDVFNKNFPIFKSRGYINGLEFNIIKKDGTILPVILQATAIYDSEGRYLKSRSTLMDHTQKKAAENLLLKTHTKLEQANKELEAFSYSVSHDLRAPLRAIIGFAKILLEDYGTNLDDEGKRVCNVIIDNTDKMGKLIDDLLSFSRLGRSEKHCAEIDMKEMISLIYDEITTPEQKHKTEFILQPTLSAAYVDQVMIKQVWSNLISNAVKYSSKNDNIKIEIGSKSESGKHIFFIKDNGIGFEMAFVDKLFGVFQRLHNVKDFEGTGVGLAIVKRIIDKHEGAVWAESWPGQGATFYFSIPKSINYE